MNPSCSHCTFLINLSGLIAESDTPDDVMWRCGKEDRFAGGWPLPIKDPANESCDKFTAYDASRFCWEWDDVKNQNNYQKHGIFFQDAVQALDADVKAFRVQSKSWESLDRLDYDEAGIPRTMANTDPVRDTYIFKHNSRVWVLVSTVRGELGLLTQRVISVRRARKEEETLYNRGLG